MTVLEDPRVKYCPDRDDYLVHGHYSVRLARPGWFGDQPAGWVVFGPAAVWVGKTSHHLVGDDEIDAKDVYPTAEAAVSRVLACVPTAEDAEDRVQACYVRSDAAKLRR